MKKYLPLLLLSATLTMTACAQTRNTTTVATKEQPAAKAPDMNFDWVKIKRGACYGRCPIYTVKVLPSGLVQYYGKGFVAYKGTYEQHFQPEAVASIFRDMQTYRIDTTQEKYEVMIADLPTLTFEYSQNGQRRTIHNAHFGPGLFQVLAKEIDKLAQVDDTWEKTGDASPE